MPALSTKLAPLQKEVSGPMSMEGTGKFVTMTVSDPLHPKASETVTLTVSAICRSIPEDVSLVLHEYALYAAEVEMKTVSSEHLVVSGMSISGSGGVNTVAEMFT